MSALRQSIEAHVAKLPAFASGRMDASTAVYAARQLEYVYARTYDVQYPELPMGEGQIVKFDTSVPRGAKTFVYYTIDHNGMAVILDTYDTASVPMVSVSGKQTVGVVYQQGLGYRYSVEDIEAAAFANVPLETHMATATKRGHVQLRDSIGWFGDPVHGMYGLLTYPNVTQTLAPFSTAVPTSRLWSDKSAQEILTDFATLVNTPMLVSLGTENVNRVYLPTAVVASLKARYVNTANGSNLTIYQSLVDNFPNVRIDSAFQLQANQHANVSQFAGLNVAVAYNDSVEKVCLVVPITFEQEPPQYEGYNTNIYTRASVGGVKCPYPISVSVMLGI